MDLGQNLVSVLELMCGSVHRFVCIAAELRHVTSLGCNVVPQTTR